MKANIVFAMLLLLVCAAALNAEVIVNVRDDDSCLFLGTVYLVTEGPTYSYSGVFPGTARFDVEPHTGEEIVAFIFRNGTWYRSEVGEYRPPSTTLTINLD